MKGKCTMFKYNPRQKSWNTGTILKFSTFSLPYPLTMLFLITKTNTIVFSKCLVWSHRVPFVNNIVLRGEGGLIGKMLRKLRK